MSAAADAAREAEAARSRTGEVRLWRAATPAEFDALPLVGTCQKCREVVDLKKGPHDCHGR